MTTPHPDDAKLRALELGQLEPADAIALRQHVDGCDECLVRLDAIAANPNLLAESTQVERIGRYVVLGALGEGGMGRVLRAWDPQLSRACALKLLKGDPRDAEARARLVREAQAMARVQHPNIVSVFDAGEAESGDVFMAMELVEGPTLDAWLRARPRSWNEVLPVLIEAGRGLRAAHEGGLVHRDFKPHNVLLREGVAKVTDFGLARGPAQAATPSGPQPLAVSGDAALTQAGIVMGSPAYMAPEQRRGEADARSDQYSFGATLFEALHGHRVQDEGPLRPVPGWLEGVVRRTLSEDPAARFTSMADVLDALDTGLRRRRLRWQVAAVSALVVPLVAFAAVDRSMRDAVCEGFDTPVRAAWNDGVRRGLDSRFGAASASWALPAWRTLSNRLDETAAQWTTRRVAVCEAARVRGATSDALYTLQGLCFDRALGQWNAVLAAVDGLGLDDERRGVEALQRLGDQLPDLSVCDDGAALTSAGQVEPVELQRAALPIRARIDQANALSLAGKGADALTLAHRYSTEARTLDNPALLGEALSLEGQLEQRFGNADQSAALLKEAWTRAFSARADAIALQAYLELLPMLVKDVGGLEQAELVATGMVERLGRTPRREGQLAFQLGNARYDLGDYAGAARDFERAVSLKREALPAGHPEVLEPLSNLAATYVRLGRVDEAIALQERVAMAILEAHGPDSVLTVAARGNWASQLVAARRDAEARPILEETLVKLEKDPSADRYALSNVLDNLAFATLRMGDVERALALRNRQVEFTQKALEDEIALLATAKAWRAEVHLHRGAPTLALIDAREAADALRTLAKNHADLPWPLLYLAEAAMQVGQVELAKRALAEAESGRVDMGDDLIAQLNLTISCVRAPSAAARAAATQALAFFIEQKTYAFEESLVARRAQLKGPSRCEW